ncbi:alpha/beta-hydrolase [Amniculicola lignicola CBS 123094]|uniref:Alpha/beta-hydrolase n=1 Tax=Amniculicola lignicola CBS 123094 TaxID=1392246 RepID=A0A6A5WN61_9PLEO|nr:alpha/beta-hydrolase [Amniculicola lignicola CBS 123094]
MASKWIEPEHRFDGFDMHTSHYKQIGEHKIEVNLLIPKGLKSGKYPVMVKFHGGGLIGGTAQYPDWFSSFFIPFLQRNSAIVVLPNYRLLPEHNGYDILSDLFTFWTWYTNSLPSYLSSIAPGLELDTDKLLVSGDSAGGFMALQSALSTPKGMIKAVIAQYPMTQGLTRKRTATFFDRPAPPDSVLEEHLANMKPGDIVSGAFPPARLDMSYTIAATKRWYEFFGPDSGSDLHPITRIETAKFFPPTVIFHGEDDSAVAIADSRAFVKKVGEVLGNETQETVRLFARPGEHGFDSEFMEDDEGCGWLKEGLAYAEGYWVGKKV